MLNIVVVDSDRFFLQHFEERLITIYDGYLNISGYVSQSVLKDDIEDQVIMPDLLFMNVRACNGEGISVAGELKKMLPLVQIVFMTDDNRIVSEIYEVEHIYLMQKDCSDKILQRVLSIARERLLSTDSTIFYFKYKGQQHLVQTDHILYFEKDKRKMRIHLDTGEIFEFYSNTENVLEKLSCEFRRCHNSYIVNMNHVIGISKSGYTLANNKVVPISRAYRRKMAELNGGI